MFDFILIIFQFVDISRSNYYKKPSRVEVQWQPQSKQTSGGSMSEWLPSNWSLKRVSLFVITNLNLFQILHIPHKRQLGNFHTSQDKLKPGKVIDVEGQVICLVFCKAAPAKWHWNPLQGSKNGIIQLEFSEFCWLRQIRVGDIISNLLDFYPDKYCF